MAHNPFEEINTRLDKLEALLKSFSTFQLQQKPQEDTIGGIDFASQITGLKRSTIYVKVSRNEIPHFKRGARVYFSKDKLTEWLTEDLRGTYKPQPEPRVLFPRYNKKFQNL